MNEIVFGLLLIAVGALFALRGYLAMRIVVPIWGALAGFLLGAGLVSNLGSERFLASAASWLVGLVVALLFGLLAYLYYEVSVVLAMSAIGFALGTSLMVAIGVTWSWLIVVIGVLTGALLAVAAIVGDLPMVLLTVLTAMAGASAIVGGVMLVVGTITDADLTRAGTTEALNDDWWWYLLYLAIAIAGVVVQSPTATDRCSRCAAHGPRTADGSCAARTEPRRAQRNERKSSSISSVVMPSAAATSGSADSDASPKRPGAVRRSAVPPARH